MPDPNRLTELQRQRALMQEHLAWLDREIAAESGGTQPTPPAPAPLPASAVFGSAPILTPRGTVTPFAEQILSQYRTESDSTKDDVRKGCFIYFALAFFVVGVGVVALYFWSKSQH